MDLVCYWNFADLLTWYKLKSGRYKNSDRQSFINLAVFMCNPVEILRF